MFNTPMQVDVEGTEFELEGNRRVFDVHISKSEIPSPADGFVFVVIAYSFTQASAAAVSKANKLRDLYLAQNSGDLLVGNLKSRFEPADVRKIEVVRTHVYEYRNGGVFAS